MSNNELEEKLKQLKIEDYIWVIYIVIIILSWYSNSLERKYFINNDLESKEKYRNLLIFIFSILVIVYFYFFQDSYKTVKNIKPWDTKEKKELTYLSYIASFLVFISGIIFLYIIYKDEELNVEIAFN